MKTETKFGVWVERTLLRAPLTREAAVTMTRVNPFGAMAFPIKWKPSTRYTAGGHWVKAGPAL